MAISRYLFNIAGVPAVHQDFPMRVSTDPQSDNGPALPVAQPPSSRGRMKPSAGSPVSGSIQSAMPISSSAS